MKSLCVLFVALAVGVLSPKSSEAAPISVTYLDPVTNWEWAEVAELEGLSWNQIDGICANDGTTACAGTLVSREFDGWIWATNTQVRDLFVNATDLTAAQMADHQEVQRDSSWAPQFFSLFSATNPSHMVQGWSATTHSLFDIYAYFPDVINHSPGLIDFAESASYGLKTLSNDRLGAWLHRPVTTPVPEPTSLLLFGTGLAGVAARKLRRKKPQQ